ncbi:DUF523 domain-containing protein [Acidaminobacter hydrogenoformans]|uniref:Uncharacterized conserved protein YbbK, DUF523 family n=1 Tax=Acidaminobacter hydrogenoformans DSM 2784 TaxID=1120920 RepID=A0A1G5RV17_9FIRM|nr:DUF523 domain-containing protein [Acidaminobacter hydrogenoformans]SCZ77560.1 Uncharacterized conserved protein YbbK, DUF523 family [Acidaminobacter hydrogenoformans DSM 2784]
MAVDLTFDLRTVPAGSRIGVSACLLGVRCKYDGTSNYAESSVKALADRFTLIPVCPEQLGGLTTPRPPAEIMGGKVVSKEGADLTAAFERGAEETLALFKLLKVEVAILKEGSPSCGSSLIYDGTFSGVKLPGAGLTVCKLRENGIPVISEKAL